MAEEEKPQQDKAAAPKKKAVKKKAPAKKRATAKKSATKPASATRAAENMTSVTQETSPSAGHSDRIDIGNRDTTSPRRHVWWRAALMIAAVVLVFGYIRNVAHHDGGISSKNMAPNPWASNTPAGESMQPHPWELAPLPQSSDAAGVQPPAPQHPWQATPQLEPWQPAPIASGQPGQTYYPPPPGPYGLPPSAEAVTPYQH